MNFLSEGDKLWSLTKETIKGVNLIENLKNILSAARSSGIKVVYVPHHLTEKGLCRLEIPGSYTSGVFRSYHL
jgi:nicotinamidase-related amidase